MLDDRIASHRPIFVDVEGMSRPDPSSSFLEALMGELAQEASVTRSFLERVPFDRSAFQPHDSSEKLGRLAIHVAEIMGWWSQCLLHIELDFEGFEPKEIGSTTELLTYFDELVKDARSALLQATEADLDATWSMRHGEMVYFTLPKRQVLRMFCMNHLIHHRAQLGVYLR